MLQHDMPLIYNFFLSFLPFFFFFFFALDIPLYSFSSILSAALISLDRLGA